VCVKSSVRRDKGREDEWEKGRRADEQRAEHTRIGGESTRNSTECVWQLCVERLDRRARWWPRSVAES
jgi:hypothetical protein